MSQSAFTTGCYVGQITELRMIANLLAKTPDSELRTVLERRIQVLDKR